MSRTSRTSLVLLATLALATAGSAHASQWLVLSAPAKGSTLPPLAQTVSFQYAIDVPGFRQHVKDFKSSIGVWITVCTGGCAASGDYIDYRQLGTTEQTATTLAIQKIKDHLTQKNLPLSTPIKWNLRFHLPGTFYDPNEVQTDSTFYVGHFEKAGTVTLEPKPTVGPSQRPPR